MARLFERTTSHTKRLQLLTSRLNSSARLLCGSRVQLVLSMLKSGARLGCPVLLGGDPRLHPFLVLEKLIDSGGESLWIRANHTVGDLTTEDLSHMSEGVTHGLVHMRELGPIHFDHSFSGHDCSSESVVVRIDRKCYQVWRGATRTLREEALPRSVTQSRARVLL